MKLLDLIAAAQGGRSRPAWGAWIEISAVDKLTQVVKSRPAWGAWIEILSDKTDSNTNHVAPRMGRVD